MSVPHSPQTKSLLLLERLLAQVRASESKNVARDIRLTELLHDPEKADPDWFMYVDDRFNAALSIVQTTRMTDQGAVNVWTQGSWFQVSRGDIFYDSADAYKAWAVGNVKKCFVVTSASPVSPAKSNGADDGEKRAITPRKQGHVAFDILQPDASTGQLVKTGHQSMTQDEFIRVLICGFTGKDSSQEEMLTLV